MPPKYAIFSTVLSKIVDLNRREREKTLNKKRIIWPRPPPLTCQYPEGFRWLTSHPNSRMGKLTSDKFGKERPETFFRGSKSFKNRFRFCTIPLVGLEEEIIDKDFTQSYWLALQFVRTMKNKPNRIFTVVCHRHPTEQDQGEFDHGFVFQWLVTKQKHFALRLNASIKPLKLTAIKTSTGYVWWKTNWVIHWIEIYPANSVIHLLNDWALVFKQKSH